jgi:hypothetical protein
MWTCSVVGDEREAVAAGAREPDAAGLSRERAQSGVRRDRLVEAPRRLEVTGAQREVVDRPGGDGVGGVVDHRLDAVAVRVEQERGVVAGAVPRARARSAVVAAARVDARPPERLDLLAVACAEGDVEPAREPVAGVDRADVPVLPLDEVGAGAARLGAERAQHGPVEALRRGEVRDGDLDVVEHRGEATGAPLTAARSAAS